MTRVYGRYDDPVSDRRDLTDRVKVGPAAMMWLTWLSAAGVSGDMKNQG